MTRVLAGLMLVGLTAGLWKAGADDPPKNEPPKAADPAPRTDRFGDPLPDGVLMRLGTTRSRANIAGFGILPDGSVVTVSPDVEVNVWPPKAERPSETVRLVGPTPPLFYPSPVVSRDGRYVAAHTPDRRLVVWERKDGTFKEAMTFNVSAPRLLFSPDNTQLAAGYFICDLRTSKYRKLENPPVHLYAIAFSGDGKRFAGTSESDAALWDLDSGKQLAGYKTNPFRHIRIALDHAGQVMAGSPLREPDTVVFTDAKTGAPIPKLTAPEKFTCCWASFAPNGKTVLLGDLNGITWWDPAAGKAIRRFEGTAHSLSLGQCVPACFSPDEKTLVATSDRMLLRWDTATGKPLLPDIHDAGHHLKVTAIGVSEDGKWIATGGPDARVRVWDARTGRPVATAPTACIRSTDGFEFSPDGRFVFGPSANDPGLTKWEAATGRDVLRFAFSPEAPRRECVNAIRLSPDGRTLLAVSDPYRGGTPALLARWDAESGKLLAEKPLSDYGKSPVMYARFSPDGRWLSTSSALHPTEVGRTGNTLPPEASNIIDSGVFSADGRLLVKYRQAQVEQEWKWRLGVFEVVTGLRVVEIPIESYSAAAFHPDGRSVAVARAKGLTFYDLATGKAFAERKAPEPNTQNESFAEAVRYFPDGTKLITGHADTTALVWDVPARPKAAKALSDKERAAAWADLASSDGAKGWAAVWALADDPGSVAFLAERIKPVEPLPAKHFDQLLADLGSEVFATREAASEQLKKAGERPAGQLRAALKGELNAEQKFRVERLLAGWAGADRKPPTGGRLRVVRAVAAAELAGTAEARKLLAELSKGAAEATTTQEAKQALTRASIR